MNAKQLSDIGQYVRYIADGLRLKDVEIDVAYDPAMPPDRLAEADVVRRRHLVLSIGRGFCEASLVDQRHGVVHELVHVHLKPVTDAAAAVGDELSAGARRTFDATLGEAVESAVDEWAKTVAERFPTLDAWPMFRPEE